MKLFVFVIALIASSVSFASPDAVYEVPGFSETPYEIHRLKLEVDGDQASIDYSLPLELTGAKNRIRAKGSLTDSGVAVLNGPHSDITCDLISKKCDVRYNDLKIDLVRLKEILQARNFSPSERDTRLSISRKFSGDPIGVIHLLKE